MHTALSELELRKPGTGFGLGPYSFMQQKVSGNLWMLPMSNMEFEEGSA